jgi:hypothetical protein
MRECGRRDAGAWAPTTALYASWAAWCERTGESRPFGPPRFGTALAHVLVRQRKRIGRGFAGFRLSEGGGWPISNDPPLVTAGRS